MTAKPQKYDCDQVLSVFLDGQVFGIPIMHIQDILKTQDLTPVPLANHAIEGVMNLRGRVVTAVNLRKRAHLKDDTDHRNAMNVVVEQNGELFSLLVDRVGEVLTLDHDAIEDAPKTLNPAWRDLSFGVLQLNNQIMVLLDTKTLFQLNGGNA